MNILKRIEFKNINRLHEIIQKMCICVSVILFFGAYILASYGDVFITSMHK